MPKILPGDKIPDFHLTMAFHPETDLYELLKEKKYTVLWCLRYLGCTFCSYDIRQIAEKYSAFTEHDAQVAVVLQSSIKTLEEGAGENGFPMYMICDPEYRIYDAMDIRATLDKAERMPKTPEGLARLEEKRRKVKEAGFVHGAYEGREQQLPALFILDQTGTAKYVHYAENSIDMPSVGEVITVLEHLEQDAGADDR